MSRSDCVLQKNEKNAQNVFSWQWCNLRLHGVFPFWRFVQERFCPEIIGVPWGKNVRVTFETCWCAEFHVGKPSTTKLPRFPLSQEHGSWHRPAAFLHISYKGATPTRSNDFQTRKCKHPVCAPGERSSSRRPLLRRSGWAISGAFPRQVPRRSAVVYKANSLQPKNQQPTTMQ